MKKKIIAFDLDDTLCKLSRNLASVKRYNYCIPLKKNIIILRELFKKGYYIKIYTARGINSYKGDTNKIYSALYEFTKKQLIKWRIPHHELIMGKQEYDLMIDDKVLNIKNVVSVNDIIKELK